MQLIKSFLAAVLLSALMVTGAAAQCMREDNAREIAEGRLVIQDATDAAGRPERPYILVLVTPACLTASSPDSNVKSTRRIHIFSSNSRVHAKIAGLVGKTVMVRGNPFAAHTAHHHAAIVMDITEIDAL